MKSPKGWPKLKRDWQGLRVTSLRELSHAYMKIGAGTKGTIITGGPVMRVMFDRCAHCSVQMRITHVSANDFELLTERKP